MKKLLASLLVLAMCAPAMAVTFSTADGGNGNLVINYALSAGEGIRGLALTLDVTSGDGKVSGTVAGTDFIVAPFNTFVDFAFDATTYNVGDGHPFADKAAAGTATLPASNLSVCLGFLDTAGAQAAVTTSGSITVKFVSLTNTNTTVAVALDTLRGGVVGDALAATAGLPTSQLLVFAQPETITTPVFTLPADPAFCNTNSTSFTASATSSLGHALEYQFTWGDGTVSSWGAATQSHTYTMAAPYNVSGAYNVTVQARCAADTAVVSAMSANKAVTREPVKYSASFYTLWKGTVVNRAACWAYARQCKGDYNGIKTGPYWVQLLDLNGLKAAYNQTTLPANGICADFNHIKTGPYHVQLLDLNILKAAYNQTAGTIATKCPSADYNFWTNDAVFP